jgi:spermidine synthase
VILLNLPEPSTSAINRCFTVEFFADARAALREGGILSVPALGDMDYHGEDTRSYLSTLYRSLTRHFPHVMIIPGMRTFLLASDRPLVQDLPALIEKRGIETMYVNRYYLDADLMARRAAGLSASLESEAPVNSDFRPLAFHRTLQSWLASFGISSWMPALLFIPLVVLLFRRRDARKTGMAAAGFACAGLQVIALLAFQSLNGSLHRDLGALFAAFMAGMAAGSGIPLRGSRLTEPGRLASVLAVTAAIAIVSPWLLEAARSSDSGFARYAAPMLINAAAGAAVGRAFAVAIGRGTGIGERKTLSALYAADLAGAAAGAFLASVYLVPLLGIFIASYLMGAVLLAAALLTALAGRRITAPI